MTGVKLIHRKVFYFKLENIYLRCIMDGFGQLSDLDKFTIKITFIMSARNFKTINQKNKLGKFDFPF